MAGNPHDGILYYNGTRPKAMTFKNMRVHLLMLATGIQFPLASPMDPTESTGNTVLTESPDFDRTALLAPDYQPASYSGLSLLNPNRFSMRQSYSVSFSSSTFGSQSAGLYLNTVSYKLADPLTLSADVGFYTPLYSGSQGLRSGSFQNPGSSSLIFPRVGLEYKPSEHSSISLQFFNGGDAWKAYGNALDPFANPRAR